MPDAPRLACPHCRGPVAANPIGHWFQKFQCPHCKKALRFDARTNNLGMAAGTFFMLMVLVAVMVRTPWTFELAAACAALWLLLLWLSYRLRRIEKA